MAKRIVTKIGDIFCAEIDGKYKVYFQYIANDLEALNSSVIRGFKRKYSLDYKPNIDEIVKDEVVFYLHTVLRVGIENGIWYKIGKSNDLELDKLKNIWFVLLDSDYYDSEKEQIIKYTPPGIWRLWHINQVCKSFDVIPKFYSNEIELGWVFSYESVMDRFKYGYMLGTYEEYQGIKRIPWDDVDSYIKCGIEDSEDIAYLHFLGKNLVSELIMTPMGKIYLDKEHPQCDGYEFLDMEFGDINWHYQQFITAEEFNDAWGDHKW
ncbi:MAG: hypothetical protein J6A20_10815 [Muribaculaceae bacterium]|nr:hypothetical protein [Muribaculaceae bacterium]